MQLYLLIKTSASLGINEEVMPMYDDLDLDWVDLLSTDPTDYEVTDEQIDELFGSM